MMAYLDRAKPIRELGEASEGESEGENESETSKALGMILQGERVYMT